MVCINLATWHFQLTAGSWKFFHSEYCNTLVLRSRLILNDKIFSIGIGIVIEFSKLRYWYWYLYWFSKSGVLVLKSVSISEIWNIEIDIGIETWFFRIKYWYWLIRAGIAHLCFKPYSLVKQASRIPYLYVEFDFYLKCVRICKWIRSCFISEHESNDDTLKLCGILVKLDLLSPLKPIYFLACRHMGTLRIVPRYGMAYILLHTTQRTYYQ